MPTILAPEPAVAEALRTFGVHNETVRHAVEREAGSHEDAAARYREKFQTQGYACIRTTDVEVFFDLREGQLHHVHHTYGPEGAQRPAWVPHFAPPRALHTAQA